MRVRLLLSVLLVAATGIGCSTSGETGCSDLGAQQNRLESYGETLASSGADVVGPRCADGGGALTLEAYFDRNALPADALGHQYTRSDYDDDRRLCFELTDGDTLEVLRLSEQVTAVVSSTTYELSCD